mmetsp:Transcript_2066/g.6870  ORF Transcript_2066/g.6870 Transcript_2066/m.6870 type:complete len:237 (+) Transcript_2066:272-982(+)
MWVMFLQSHVHVHVLPATLWLRWLGRLHTSLSSSMSRPDSMGRRRRASRSRSLRPIASWKCWAPFLSAMVSTKPTLKSAASSYKLGAAELAAGSWRPAEEGAPSMGPSRSPSLASSSASALAALSEASRLTSACGIHVCQSGASSVAFASASLEGGRKSCHGLGSAEVDAAPLGIHLFQSEPPPSALFLSVSLGSHLVQSYPAPGDPGEAAGASEVASAPGVSSASCSGAPSAGAS